MKLTCIVIGVTALGMAGCVRPAANSFLPVRRPLEMETTAFQAPADPAVPKTASPPIAEPEGEIDLRSVLATALMRSPRLASASWEVRAGEARRLQAGVLPNPELEMEAEEFAGSGEREGFDTAEISVSLSQIIELGGKRSARVKVAEIEGKMAGWNYEAERLAVLTDATLGFIGVLAAQERLVISRGLVAVSEQMASVVEERVKAGKVAPIEKSKAMVELAVGRIGVATAESELRFARRLLAAVWGSVSPRFTEAKGSLDGTEDVPSWDGVYSFIEQSPEIARWAQEMEHRFAVLALEKANRVPDIVVGLGLSHSEESNDRWASFGLGFSLPLFDRNQGGVREARYQLEKLKPEQAGARMRTVLSLARAHEALLLARREVLGFANSVLPSARVAFDAAREGYRQGKFGYLEVLDAQRTFFEATTDLLEARARYHKAVCVVEGMIGTRLDSLGVIQGKEKN